MKNDVREAVEKELSAHGVDFRFVPSGGKHPYLLARFGDENARIIIPGTASDRRAVQNAVSFVRKLIRAKSEGDAIATVAPAEGLALSVEIVPLFDPERLEDTVSSIREDLRILTEMTLEQLSDKQRPVLRTHKSQSRVGKRTVSTYVSPEAHRALRQLCFDQGTSIDKLMSDLIDEVLNRAARGMAA